MENEISSSFLPARLKTDESLAAAAQLQALPPAERTRVLIEWNATQRDYPLDHSVNRLFEAQADRTPGATALVFGEQRLSYDALNARANQLAHALRARSVGHGTLVAIAIERGIEMVVALLGVLKAGGAYVPMDPDAPAERMAFMLSDAKPVLLLTRTTTHIDDAAIDVPVVSLDALAPELAAYSQTNPDDVGFVSSQLAYVIYTSGTTGTPKGVLVSHSNLINFCYWCVEVGFCEAGDRVTQFAPYTFDASAGEIFGTLLTGAELHLLDDATIQNPSALQHYLSTHAIHFSAFPPAYLQQMDPDAAPADFRLLTAGSAPTPDLVKRWAGRGDYLNGYGPTETTILSTSTSLSADTDTITVGRPISNTQVYLLDAQRQLVPIGAVGEIYIGGAGVALGYLNRPELTAELFLDDPFNVEPGARMYKTGDQGRWLPDGTIEFLGRNDFQVKIRGFRIELGEIEAKLAACEGVREAVVIAREDGPGEKQLVAYCLAEEALDAFLLRGALSQHLPDYMLPSAFVRMAAWPLTANGKIDRKALPAPGDDAYARREYTAPEGDIEQMLAGIWAEHLKLDWIGREDNFFELGGHSLLAISVVNALRQNGLYVDIASLLMAPTLMALAAEICRESKSQDAPPNLIERTATRITPEMLPLVALTQEEIDVIVAQTEGGVANVQDIYPLSPLQEGMLFHHRLTEQGDIYLLASVLAFDDRQRLDSFLSAMRQVVARHDVLRTAIVWEGLDVPVQVVRRAVELAVEEIDLGPVEGGIAQQLEMRYDPQHYRVDLRHPPLMHLYVACDAEHQRWLVRMLAHHIVMDHMGYELMLHEVRAIERGQLDTLQPAIPYRDFVARTRQHADHGAYEQFFRSMLSDVTEPTAPFGIINTNTELAPSEVSQALAASLSEAIRQHCRRLGISPGSFMHLAWALVLARTTGLDTVVFGTVLFGRMGGGDNADRALGLFINTLPVRIDIGETHVDVSLKQTHVALAQLMRHEHAPLALAQRCSGITGQAPLFTSLMNYRYSEKHGPYGDGTGISLISESERTNYAIAASVDDFGADFGLVVSTQYGLDSKRLCDYLHAAISGLVDALDEQSAAAVCAIDVLSRPERDQVLRQRNDTAQDHPQNRCLHALFESHAKQAPDAIALVFGDDRISYRHLNARANQLAHHLRGLGLSFDDRVVLCVDRSIEMVVAILGVLKAGAAYVPIEPGSPPERIAHILSDSMPSAVLVHGEGHAAVVPHLPVDVPLFDLQRDQGVWLSQSEADPSGDVIGHAAQHLAYVIYTSGTTGAPKGVMVEHRSATNIAVYGVNAYAITPQDRCLQFSSYSFDPSVLQIFSTLAGGATLVLRDQTLWSAEEVSRQIGRHRITIAGVPPSYLEALVSPVLQNEMPDLRVLVVGGEATLSEAVRGKSFLQKVLNEYGPTEATVLATAFAIDANEAIPAGANYMPIGRPIANVRVYILDKRKVPVPVGVTGEIYIGGDGLARGYLNQPELTAERFLDDPFSDEAGARMYRTGDLGRWMAEGHIEYLGRNDFQVKIRGFRVELGEIEAALAACEGVREALVLARNDVAGEQRLAAYYVADHALDVSTLRDALALRLPEYMLPAAFVWLVTWPLTSNGKIDRNALPAPDDTSYARHAYAAPVGEVEQALAAIWSELFGLESIGRDDNFFELGGHSLLAVQLSSRLHRAFLVDVPLRAVFESPTLSQLAGRITQADASSLSTIAVVQREPRMPLSLAQQRLWVLTQIDGASTAYHMGGTLQLQGALDCTALEHALQRIVDRHEALRTRFVLVDGQPMQAIMAEARIVPAVHDVRGQANRDTVCRELCNAFMAAPFDLQHDLPLRVQLVQLEEHLHELQVVMHHIVSDGWSIGIMLDELSQLYAAEINGQPNPLPPLPIQYVDYSQWQRQWLADGQFARQAAFWQRNLVDAPTLLELPTDRRRPAQQNFVGDAVDVRLDATLTAELKALSQRYGVTLYMTMLASWAAVLGRLSNQDDIVIGSPVAGRNRAEIEPLIGFFVNTLALRIDLSGDSTVSQLLARTKQQVLDAQAHQDLPFDQVVEVAKPSRSMAYSPIFQVMLAWQNQSAGRLVLPGIEVSSIDAAVKDAQFDLTLSIGEVDGEIIGDLNYVTALFDLATVARFVQCWMRLLHGIVANPEQPIAHVPMLDAHERTHILDTWNQTGKDYSLDLPIHALFEAQVARTPDAIALSFRAERLSYAELNRHANRLAHQLRALGIKPEDRVAICMERGTGMVVAVLAALKSGGAYVPLDPAFPHERLGQIIEDSAPLAALVDGHGREVLARSAGSLLAGIAQVEVSLQSVSAAGSEQNLAGWPSTSMATHPAYVLFTSGSTGRPKGVSVPHRAAVNFLLSMAEAPGLGSDDTLCAVTTLSFDIALLELLLPLTVGARVALADRATAMDAEALMALFDSVDVTVMQATPATWRMLLDAGWRGRAGMRMLCGGEALPLELAERLLSCGDALWNMYGPTETTVWSMIERVLPGQSRITLGRPIANTRVYLLDAQRQPVPIGVAGELHIGGAGVALGYLGRPDLTVERFLDDPFNVEPDARMYKTGDLGRWLPDGTIEFLGRNDFQVKIRGFRIELGEIEAALAACEGVREAVVIAREDGQGEQRLVAYCIVEDALDASLLRGALSEHLPDYMLPSAFVRMEAWPLTNNGKLDRKALPSPDDASYARRVYAAPQGAVEESLAQLWSELLGIGQVGRDDGFFEVGGHSLLAVQLMSRLHKMFDVDLPLRALFESPTLSQLAARIAEAETSQLSAIVVAEREAYMPLSLAQQRLWVLTQIDGASAAYHMGGAMRLEGVLDRMALERSFQRIVDRHEALRTRFVLVDGQPMQTTMADARIVPSIHDLRGQSDRDTACRGMSDAFMAMPFDLRHDLPLRVQLILLENDVHIMQVVMHHIVSDGWSIGIMVDELSRLYAADLQGQADPLPPLPIQYVDYSQWQRQWLADGQLARQAAFWQRTLADAPTLLELPTDRRRAAQQDFAGDAVNVRLDTTLTAGLKALSRRHGVTLYMTLLASWAAVLGRLSNQDDVVVGSPVAGRNRAEIEPLIGFFVNTLAFRIDLSGDPTLSELLMRTRRQVLDAQAHQDLPFDQVLDAVKPPRSMAHTPIFQTMLAWQNQGEARMEMPGMEITSIAVPAMTANFDLTLNLGEVGGEIVGLLNYATALFDSETAVRYVDYWHRLLSSMAALPAVGESSRTMSDMSMLAADERARVLTEWNATQRDYPLDRSVSHLFEAQAARTPEATALVFGEQRLSYDALNARANQLAHALRARGVGHGTLVAIAIERGIEMVVALLAVLKAGGGYVPMAPDAPAERMAFMLSDAKPVLLFTRTTTQIDDAAIDVPVLSLDALAPELAAYTQTNPDDVGFVSSQLAYVIYTSGTTGTPKGVLVSHSNLINFCYWCVEVGFCEAGDRVTQFAPYTFDASAGEIFGTLLTGAELHLLADATIQDPSALQRYLGTHAINFSAFPPAYLQQMDPDAALAEFRLLTAGSAPTPDLVKRWAGRGDYLNGYGPTETTILSTSTSLSADTDTITVGRPISNTQVYLLDAQRKPVPIGVAGEIYIGGAGVTLGYLNRPELTAELFLDDPFNVEPGARMYKTGDLGRWLPDGTIEFLGRNDFQVKIRGFRIELGEIEARLVACDGVREAVVLAREDGPGEKQLVAYCFAEEALDASLLRESLSQHLPDYMLPSAFVRMDAWPLTANGKIDRKALPAPDDTAYARRAYVAPEGEVEEALARIWATLLTLERVGRDDNFFELGGHSLLAIQLMSRLHKAFDVEVPLRALFESPTLSQLAARIAQAEASQQSAITVVQREAHMPLSLAQQRLWVLTQIDGASAAYHMGGALKLEGVLDRMALERAFQRIVDRHEALRTRFVSAGEQPMQVIMAEARIVPVFHDLRSLSDRDTACRQLCDVFMDEPFNLQGDLLFRAQLVQLEDGLHEMHVVMHHIVSDGWSIGIMLNELSQLYTADVQGKSDPLPALPIQYVDYSQWQRQWLAEGQLARQTAFWQRNLAGAPMLLELPSDRRRSMQQDFAGDVLTIRLERDLTAALKALSQRHGVTMYMTLLASWAAVLGRLSSQEDVVIGSPVAGRNRAEIEPLIGFFVNTLALRIDLSGDPTVSELLARTRQQVLDAQAHQDLPFDQVVEAVKPPRSLAHTPIFQVMLSWGDAGWGNIDLQDLSISMVNRPHESAKFDLTMDLVEDADGIKGELEYATALFDRDTVERHLGYFRQVLEAMVSSDAALVHEIELLDQQERQLLDGYNDTYRPELIDRTWPELFVEQAARTPDAIAVECETKQLTYRELETQSAQLAASLKREGVGADTIVALLDHRSSDLLVMIVAVLRAGGAYLAMDPSNPPQRWLDIIEAAAPVAVLTGDAFASEQQWLAEQWHVDGASAGGKVHNAAALRATASANANTNKALPIPSLNDLAYVIFTSGSTGKPKGVMIEHRGMINNMRSKFEPLSLSANDVIAQTASQSFDISVWQFLTVPLLGGRVSIVSNASTRDPDALLARLAHSGVTIWEPVPSVMQAILPFNAKLPAMRWVLPTGEALPRDLVTRWFAQYPGIPLMNAYGPAECSDDVSLQPMHGPVERVSIGMPVANAHLHVVDAHLMRVPMGVVGELAISGPVVGRGYLGRPEETLAAFRQNPYAKHASDQRLYLTGDLVRRLRDGSLEYIGRNDFQVKIRGFRIELGEIETTLAACEGVREAVVTARQDMAGEQRLVAYYLADDALEAIALREQVSQHLPEYMLPSAFVRMEAWPLTNNGKLDRKALPAPEGDAYANRRYEAPEGDIETALVQIWSELLGIERISRHDNFFDLGGNSILLIRMLARLRDQDLLLSVVDVYRLGSVEAIAAAAGKTSLPLTERLALAGLTYVLTTVGDAGAEVNVLLVDACDATRRARLQELLSGEEAATVAFVRVCVDPAAEAGRLRKHGLAALDIEERISVTALQTTLRAQLDLQRARIETAPTVEEYPFSAIQRNFQAWSTRDSMAHATVVGWYTPEALQAAFAALVCEHDVLRSAADLPASRWRLLDVAAVNAAPLPAILLRPEPGLAVDSVIVQAVEVLTAARNSSPLAYAGAWISMSETEHHLVLWIDHLIWDGASDEALQRRLDALLRNQAKPILGSYRQFAAEIECQADRAIDMPFHQHFERAAVAATMAATSDTLARRSALPLRAVMFSLPLSTTGSPAEQAFEGFKQWALRISALDRLGLVLTHHGRQRGRHGYFDHIGLFLDKIPFAVGVETTLQIMTDTVAELQKQGLGYVAMERRACEEGLAPTLPPLAEEVLFNFQSQMMEDGNGPAGWKMDGLEAGMGDYRGLLFEGIATPRQIHAFCLFRGSEDDVQALVDAFPGCAIIESRVVPFANTSLSKASDFSRWPIVAAAKRWFFNLF